MIKRIIASVLMFIGAAFVLTYGVFIGLAGKAAGVELAQTVAASVVSGVSAGMLTGGGALTLSGKKQAFILSLVGLAIAFVVYVPVCFLSVPAGALYKWMKNLLLACRIIAPVTVAVSLIVMPKIKGALYCMCCFFSVITALFLSCYGYLRYESVGLLAIYVIFGALGFLFAALGGVFAHKKRESAFSMTLMALLVTAGQFIIACAMCTQINGIVHIILGFGGLIMSIIGGVLIADTNESGFIIVAFGIIFLLFWFLYTLFMVNKAIALGLLCVMVSLILTAALVLTSRLKREN
ncbi:MAG: hypothetical protein NC131_05385 [Roseburia sp.]|nr:hypothetical protein [Roseburia sp.]